MTRLVSAALLLWRWAADLWLGATLLGVALFELSRRLWPEGL
jgi:hypothetical protein